MSDIPALQPIYFSGIRTDIKGNAHYINNNEVLYPNGSVLILYNSADQRQKYIRLPDRGSKVNLICVSPNRRIIAVAETGEPPTISIYDAESLKRKKQISAPADRNITTKQIESMAFTYDSKSLVVIYGDPDWTLITFNYEKAKAENYTRANNINCTGTVRQVACNPNDATVLVVVGETVFRLLAITENVWRQYGYSKTEQLNLTCVTWLSQDRVLAGTNDGRVMVVENAELKLFFYLDKTPVLVFHTKGEEPSAAGLVDVTSDIPYDEMNEIRSIVPFSKGFVVAKADGKVHLYEKESAQMYNKKNIFTLIDPVVIADASPPKLHHITVSPDQDNMIMTCSITQMFWTYLWGPDLTKQPETLFQPLGPLLHRGPVINTAVCSWKPILMTVGRLDRVVAVWNYETRAMLLRKVFHEDVYGVDLHPTGLYAIVGFSGKLRYLTLQIDNLSVVKELPVRYCAVCAFSRQGHLFAAVNGNVIQIYSSITFVNVINLKGHNGKVTSLSWTSNDYKMISCGSEGAIYEWDMLTGQRLVEIVSKRCSFTETRSVTNGSISYVAGSDGILREIANSAIRTRQKLLPNTIDCMDLSRSDLMLFASGQQGVIYSIKIPLTEKPAFVEHIMHRNQVVRLQISYDDRYLISSSMDGTICIWRLINTMGKAIQMDKDFKPSPDILISYKDLNEKQQALQDLTTRIYELEKENTFRIRKLETKYTNKACEIHEAYVEAIQELKHKNNVLEVDHAQKVHKIQMSITQMKQEHEHEIQVTEESYNEKLITEYEKFARLDDRLREMKKSYEDRIEVMEKEREESEAKITGDFLQKLHDKDRAIEELGEEIQQLIKDNEVIKQQIEDDADREIYEMKVRHEVEMNEEQNANLKLRSENSVLHKKMNSSQKMMDELKHQIFTLDNEHAKFKSTIADLEKDITELKKEIIDRDTTIQDKEKKIYDLKRRTQELEKYKFVLEFKMRNLKEEEEPRERKIQEQKEQMQDMINELEALQKEIASLNIHNQQLDVKLSAAVNECKREQVKVRQAKKVIKAMHTDIYNVTTLIQEPEQLKLAIKKMYHKHRLEEDYLRVRKEDCEVRTEFRKQRAFLERTVEGLKKNISTKESSGDLDKIKIIDESSALIVETNKLRGKLKDAEKQNKQMESILGVSSKFMMPSEARKRLADAVQTKEQIQDEYREILENKDKYITLLKEENKRLTAKIAKDCFDSTA